MLLCQPPVHLKQEVPSVQELKRKERASEKYLMFTDMSLATMWKLQIMYREGGGRRGGFRSTTKLCKDNRYEI